MLFRSVPTQRAEDGLALSSRNAYLTDEERKQALGLPRAMREAARQLQKGESASAALAKASDAIVAGGFDSVDYIELRDAASLEVMDRLDRPARLLAAARIGGTRLIDNIAVNPE